MIHELCLPLAAIFSLAVHHQAAHEYTYDIKALQSCQKSDRYQHVASEPETMIGKKGCAEQCEAQGGEHDPLYPEEGDADRKPDRSARTQENQNNRHDEYLP
jgi:hypothetical protein